LSRLLLAIQGYKVKPPSRHKSIFFFVHANAHELPREIRAALATASSFKKLQSVQTLDGHLEARDMLDVNSRDVNIAAIGKQQQTTLAYALALFFFAVVCVCVYVCERVRCVYVQECVSLFACVGV